MLSGFLVFTFLFRCCQGNKRLQLLSYVKNGGTICRTKNLKQIFSSDTDENVVDVKTTIKAK